MLTPWITELEVLGEGKFKVDDSVYSAPQFLINHVKLQEVAISDRDKQITELQEKLAEAEISLASAKVEHAEKLHRRNMQIAELRARKGLKIDKEEAKFLEYILWRGFELNADKSVPVSTQKKEARLLQQIQNKFRVTFNHTRQ